MEEQPRTVADFVSQYYSLINENPSLVHTMYHQSSSFHWPIANGSELKLKTSMTVKRFFVNHTVMKLKVQSKINLPLQNGILLIVRGTALGAQNPGFVQVLHLSESDGHILVMDDVLSIMPGRTLENTGEVKLSAPSIPAGTKSVKNIGNTVAGTSAYSSGTTEQSIARKSRSGRKLKPSHHAASINQLLSKQNYAPAFEPPKEEASVLIIYDARMLKHVQVPIPGEQKCPELPGRIKQIINQFKSDGLYDRCEIQTSEMASFPQLELMHDPGYVQFISKLPQISDDELSTYVDGRSMYLSEGDGTKIASFIAVGCVLKACDAVAQNMHSRAFAVMRPPGHHAMKSKADGYCVFNNVAVGASYIIQKYMFKKVLVVDFDIHHGNGTQSLFYDSNSVLFISIHSSELEYPEGNDRQISYVGEGAGEGFNVNIPLKGNYGDSDMIAVWNQIVLPIAKEFEPDVVFISAGYDAAKGDPMAECEVTEQGYATMTAKICSIGTGCVIMVLEGGYNQRVTGRCSSYSVRAMLGDDDVLLDEQKMDPPLDTTMEIISEVKASHNQYWLVLAEEAAA